MTAHKWQKSEIKVLVGLAKQATTMDELVQAAGRAFAWKPKLDSLSAALRLHANTTPRALFKAAAPTGPLMDADAETIRKVVKLARSGNATLEDLCNSLDSSPKRVEYLLKEAGRRGFAVQIHETGGIGFRPAAPSGPQTSTRLPVPAGENQSFMVASDIHIGSNHFLKDQFLDFIHNGYERGIRLCLIPGDILDGCYRHSRWEESHHGFDAQSNYAAEIIPQLPGLSYVGITGNHDETFETDVGLSVVHALPQVFATHGRADLTLVGARGGYLHLRSPGSKRGAFVELWHPGKGCAYALSYKLQKHIEVYAVGQKPDMVFAGHWHQQCYFTQRGVHAFSSGTWHGGQSAFGRSIGGSPAIGGWYVSYRQTEEGTLREVQPTWIAYYERESPRAVTLA